MLYVGLIVGDIDNEGICDIFMIDVEEVELIVWFNMVLFEVKVGNFEIGKICLFYCNLDWEEGCYGCFVDNIKF